MGLDMTIVKAERRIDLRRFYAVLDTINNGYDWYLGDDKSQRSLRWHVLLGQLKSITLNELLPLCKYDEADDYIILNEMPDSEFRRYLELVIDMVRMPSSENDTHLSFDTDYGIPGTEDIYSTCDWELRHEILDDAVKDGGLKFGDVVVELDKSRLRKLAGKWETIGKVLPDIKTTWCQNPDAAARMMSLALDRDIEEVDFNLIQDIQFRVNAFKDIKRGIPIGLKRLWMVSSY